MSVKHWLQPLKTFVDEVNKMAKRVLLQTLESVMGPYRQTELFRELTRIIEGFLSRLNKEYLANCVERYRAEASKPFTLAGDLHKSKMEESLRILIERRNEMRKSQILKANGESDKRSTKVELGPDEYSPEIEMMAVRENFSFSEISRHALC